MSATQNTITRLIVKVAHDSLIATSTVLNNFIVQGRDRSQAFVMADSVEDSQPIGYATLQHFFANHYNQLLTILLSWRNDEVDFGALIERDCQLNYTGGESVLLALVKETASNFSNCPMLKDSFMLEREN